jgi:dihydroorotate dehydrogenase
LGRPGNPEIPAVIALKEEKSIIMAVGGSNQTFALFMEQEELSHKRKTIPKPHHCHSM